MKMRLAAMAVFLFLALWASLALSAAHDSMADTVRIKCSACHDMPLVCAQIGKRDAAGWQATITRMVGYGVQLASDEAGRIAAFLASDQAGTQLGCD